MAYEQEYPLINGTSNNIAASTPDELGAGWITAALDSSTDVDYFKLVTTSAALIELDLSNLLVSDSKLWSVALVDANGEYLRSLTSTVSGSPVVDGSSNSGTTLKITGLAADMTADMLVGSRFSFVTSGTDSTLYTVSSATSISGGGSTLTLTSALPSNLAASTALAFDPAQVFADGGLTALTGQVSAAGTYYAKVTASNWTDADYTIRAAVLKTVETADNDDKLDAIASGTSDLNRPVENAWMSGALSGDTDTDVWVFSTATMAGSLTLDFAAVTGSANSPEWDITLTQWSGNQPLTNVQGVALSGTADNATSFTIDVAKYSSATTFVVSVAKASGVTVDTGTYALRLSGATLDLNDTPLITIDSVTSSLPYEQIDTLVSRSVKAGADSKVALSTLFSVTDADASQSIASYNVALSKATDETASMQASIQLLASNGTIVASYALDAIATLTAEQMAIAYLVPGSVLGDLSLALQAVDSSGASDGSGASSVMLQTLRVVSSAVGVLVSNDGALSLEEGNAASTESLSLSLGAAPTADVKVYLEQDSYSRFGLSTSVLTFTSANWGTAQTVVLTARDNQTTEGTHTGNLSFRAVSTDSQYDGYAISDLVVSIVDPINVLPTGAPTVSGTLTEDQELTASATGVTDPDGLGTPNYTWQRSTDGNTWTDISQATNATYTLGDADATRQVRVKMGYTDDGGTQETVYSAASTIANLNDLPTGTVTITGTATQGQTLTASNTLADADGLGTIAYQWSAAGTAISGATSSTYKVTAAQVGKAITVAASYADRHGTAESVASSATDAVQASASISHMTTPASAEFSAALPVGLFDAASIQGPFTYTVTWAHGSELYGTLGSWLRFDSTALTFSGTPSQAAIGYYPIVITATNAAQESVTGYASISVYNPIDGNMDITGVGSGNPPDWGLTTKPDSQTVDVTSPVISKSGPLDASEGIATDAVLYFRFSEEVQRGTGDIRLLHGTDLVDTFHVDTSEQLTLIYDTTLKLTPSRPMVAGGAYTVEFDTQAFTDKAGNALAVGQQVTFSTYDGTSGQRVVVDASDSQGREFLFFSEHSIQGAGQMQGGNGWDCYWIDSLQDRVVDTGTDPKDYDWVSYSFTPSVIDMANFPAIESWRLKGEVTGPITFRGNDLGNEGSATSFNDTLYGFGGSDQLEGAGGADLMYGGLGDDVFLIENLGDKAYESSGEGFDIAYVNGVVGYRFDYDTEIEAVYVGDGASVDLYPSADGKSATLLSNFINNAGAGAKNAAVNGGDGADGVIGFDGAESISGGGGADLLSGNGGADLIDGGTGDDLMSGGDGADTLVGGLGADIIYSGDGNDSVDAGDGNDLIVGGSGAGDDAYIGGAGIDTVKYTSATAGISIDLTLGTATSTQGKDAADIGTDTLTGIENIIAGNYSDTLVGSALANAIDAGTGNDTVTGGGGDDSITGNGGDDSIDGGAGTDQAVFSAAKANYTVTSTATGFTVKDNVGTEGTDTLTNIEAIVFADQTLSFGKTVDIQAYSWKAHTLLEGVAVGIGSTSQSTGSLGSASFAAITDTAITLSATRTVPSGEAVTTAAAVNLQDAIAILKMIVGLEVNGTGKALSPYQALAADYDGNGLVQLSDAIGVLKHVVGLTAPNPTWHFVNEIDSSVLLKASLTPGVAQTSIAATLSGTSPVHVGLVGYLSGDVDGSFAGASGASALTTSYFTTLVGAHSDLGLSFNAAQFGIY